MCVLCGVCGVHVMCMCVMYVMMCKFKCVMCCIVSVYV